jgi:DNA helicase-2/ATP-dependent DNA helicase PcrA
VNQNFSDNFNREYLRLNPEQKQAVDTIEGPVMVIAGAGTGKTQTIALRIANILQKTQTPPSSILCLTFTDSAAVNMRQRLISIIGPTAYSVKICTFHAFCNEIILSHPDYFIFAKSLAPADDLEKIEIVDSLIDQLPTSSPLKPWGDYYYYRPDLLRLIQSVKRENITPEIYSNLIEDQAKFINQTADLYRDLKSMRAGKSLESELLSLVTRLIALPNISPAIISQISYQLGLYESGGFESGAAKSPAVNFKNSLLHLFDQLIRDLPRQQDVARLYQAYQSELTARGLYDFDDMILYVINAFASFPDLLLNYQELYHYFLVDEFQDTNSAQNQILDQLASYFSSPNLFVVGDDDQAIFRFQGASIENIHNFQKKYQPRVYVLCQNYRSHQLILDSASSVIGHNHTRISNYLENIDKSLKSAVLTPPVPINLLSASAPVDENYYLATQVKRFLDQGTPPSSIAILFRNNADIDDLCPFLSAQNISYYLSCSQKILDTPLFFSLINLLSLILHPGQSHFLYQLLCSPFVSISSVDLLKILRYSQKHNITISDLLNEKSKLSTLKLKPATRKKLKRVSRLLAKSQKWLQNYPLYLLFQIVIRRFGFIRYCLRLKDPVVFAKLYTLSAEIRRLSTEKNFSLSDLLARFNKYSQNHLPLSSPPLSEDTEKSVQLMTVHHAKGLEFDHVFLYKVVDKKWGNNPDRGILRPPPGILKTEMSRQLNDSNEDERRLFYVALTRAKQNLHLSFSNQTDTGRPQLPSVFISEINPACLKIITPDNNRQQAYESFFSVPKVFSPPLSLQKSLHRQLSADYRLSYSHLSGYLECPFCFYNSKILRLPLPQGRFAALGTAIHAALSFLYNFYQANNRLPPADEVVANFTRSLTRHSLSSVDLKEATTRGQKILTDYYKEKEATFSPKAIIDYDFKADNILLDGIPLTGKIDKIDLIKDNVIDITDFKTGNPDSSARHLSPTGDYFRQLVFYSLLVRLSPKLKYQVRQGVIEFVAPSARLNTFVTKRFDITPTAISDLEKIIKEVYAKIIALDFFHLGPDCPDRDHLHYLFKYL